jgi:hypothetical protein
MKKVGNIASNKIYNPQNKMPSVPVDADEADSAMERFIRAKYMPSGPNGTRRHNTGSTESDEGTPPKVPPKTPGKFGFRSASSIFPLGHRAKKEAALRNLTNPRDMARSPSPRLANKPSKVFGASVEYDGSSDDSEKKLARLRDMGFMDQQRNAVVLKGVNGNLERAIEALVRLGEGDRKSPLSLTSPRESSLRATRSLTPITPTYGLNATQPPAQERPITPSTMSSNNPFDIPPAQPQSSQSTGTLQNKNPYFSNNPFGLPSQQSDLMAQAFQTMSLAPQQALFPHHTGPMPAPQPNSQAIYQQSLAPPVQPMPQNYGSMSFNTNLTYPQPAPLQASYNPFFAQNQAPVLQQALSVNTATIPGNFGNNPFTRSPTRIQSPPLGQIPEQAQQNFFAPQPQVQPHVQGQVQPQMTNPFFAQQAMQAHAPQMPMPTVQPMYQQPQRPDKASIMALYNYPQYAPGPVGLENQTQTMTPSLAVQPNPQASPHRSVSSPLPGSKNPFLSGPTTSSAPAPAAAPDVMAAGRGHASRESMAFAMENAWANGRHSPDAFASLSARHM